MNGLDLSSNNVVTEAMLKAWHDVGYSFITHRLTVGTWVDPTFAERWEMIGDAGFYRSFYHVNLPLQDPVKQMAACMSAFAGRKVDYPAALDCEVIYDKGAGRNAKPSETDANVGEHVTLFNKMFGYSPLIYSNQNYGNIYLKSNHGCELWFAWPGSGGVYNPAPSPAAAIPIHWKMSELRFWQRSWTQKLPLSAKVYDLDEWQGTEESFRLWAKLDVDPIVDLRRRVEALEKWRAEHDPNA